MTDTPVTANLAHLHLQTGLPVLARVELETLAGRGELDVATLADLAEARWRGGDLAEAGAAGQAHLDKGGDEPRAQVVVVEAQAAAGRPRDARQLALRVVGRGDVDDAALDDIFAGRPRSGAWPQTVSGPPADADAAPPAPTGRTTSPTLAGERTPADTVASAERALARGDAATTAVGLAVALREEPALAALVLTVAEQGLGRSMVQETGATVAALHLVRGDALRLLGRSSEASAAFQRSRRVLEAAAPREDTP